MRWAVVLAILLLPVAGADVPWQREALGVPDHLDGSGVLVAILDSGIQHNHPDLDGAIWVNDGEVPGNGVDDDGNGYVDDIHGWDFCDEQPREGRPQYGHGTSVSGTVAGRGVHALGVAPGATVMDIGIICSGGGYPTEQAILETEALREAIRYAVANGADIIVMSLQNWNDDGYSLLEQLQEPEEEFQAARDAGVLIVVAAGNHGRNQVSSPADQPGVFVVGGMEPCGYPRFDSNRGSGVDIWAFSTYFTSKLGGTNHTIAGTSFAAPQIAGLAALVLQENPGASPAEVEARLLRDALDTSHGKMANAYGTFGSELPPAPQAIKYVGSTEVGNKFYLQFEGAPSTFLHLKIPGAQLDNYCPHRTNLDEGGFVIYTRGLPNPLTISARLHDGLQAGPWTEFTVQRDPSVADEEPQPWMVDSTGSNDAPAASSLLVLVGMLVFVAARRTQP